MKFIILLFIALATVNAIPLKKVHRPIVGGHSSVEITESVEAQALKLARSVSSDKRLAEFKNWSKVLIYEATQVVAGQNFSLIFRITSKTTPIKFAALIIYQRFDGTASVSSFGTGKTILKAAAGAGITLA